MILLDPFPVARFQFRSPLQDLLARVLKIHRCLSQFGVLFLDRLRYLYVERIDTVAQLVDELLALVSFRIAGLRPARRQPCACARCRFPPGVPLTPPNSFALDLQHFPLGIM
jgi:hypothetical protein